MATEVVVVVCVCGGGGGGGFYVRFTTMGVCASHDATMHLIRGPSSHRPSPCGEGPPAPVLMTGAQKNKVGPVPVHRAPTAHPP